MHSKNKKRSICGVVLSLFLATSAFALQVVTVNDNAKVALKIARQDYTRIFVAGDRISDVKGKYGQYILRKDNSQGQIYVTPTRAYQHKKINLFVTTENGHNYQLQLRPVSMSPNSIQLQSTTFKNPEAKDWEESSPYKAVIRKLLTAMYTQSDLDNYTIQDVNKAKSIPLGNVAAVTLKRIYVGDHLKGEVYEIQNQTDKTLRLQNTQLYREGALAIGLEDHLVQPHSTTRLLMVTHNA